MEEGWIIFWGIFAIVVGAGCLGTFIPLTAVAMYRGWDAADDILRLGRQTPAYNAQGNHARWRRPAWRLGYRMREVRLDNEEFEAWMKDQRRGA